MPIAALPTDALSLVLAQLSRVHNIMGVKRTCRAFRDAAGPVEQDLRRRSGEYEHERAVRSVAAAPGGRLVTGSHCEVKVWRDGACERTTQAPSHAYAVEGVAVLLGGARFVSVSCDGTAKLWTLDAALELTVEVGAAFSVMTS